MCIFFFKSTCLVIARTHMYIVQYTCTMYMYVRRNAALVTVASLLVTLHHILVGAGLSSVSKRRLKWEGGNITEDWGS